MAQLNTHDIKDLLWGNPQHIAADLAVTVRTVQRWQAGQQPPPAMVKLLRMRYGDLAGLLGTDWEGFCFGRDGLLYHPFYKYGFAPGELRALFFTSKEVGWYRQEFKKMRAELARIKTELWAAKQVRSVARRGQILNSVEGR